MFDEKEYREVFSRVTASEETFRRVMQMKQKKVRRGRGFVMKALAAAAIISALAVTASASERVASWFQGYFAENAENGLTAQQGMYLDENEQVINEAQVQDGWTIEMRSALNDGAKAYIIIGITAPEHVNLEQTLVDGGYKDWIGPGNGSMNGAEKKELVSCSVPGYVLNSYSFGLEEDGDGLRNTKNLVIALNPSFDHYQTPFGREVEWYIHIENIVYQYEDEAYRQGLLNGKYKGQTEIIFTSEETKRLYCEDVLVEGNWDFTINFAESELGIELLAQPIEALAFVHKKTGTGIDDIGLVYEKVTIQSFVLKPLSAVVTCSEKSVDFEDMYVVMKDGSEIFLNDTGSGFEAELPIVLSDVDHVRMGDGTIIPMPEQSE